MYCGTPMKAGDTAAAAENVQEQAEAATEGEAEAMFNQGVNSDGSYNYAGTEEAAPANDAAQAEPAGSNVDGLYVRADANAGGSYDQAPAGDGSYGADQSYGAQPDQQAGYAPYPAAGEAPAQPAQGQYYTQPAAPAKEKKPSKAPMIVFLILAIVFLAGSGVFAYLFFTQKVDLDKASAENTELTTTVDDLNGKVDKLEGENRKLTDENNSIRSDLNTAKSDLDLTRSDYDSLKESYDDLQNDYDTLQDELYKAYAQNGEEGSDGYNFGLVKNFYSNNVYSDFFANKDIVVLRKGDVFSIKLNLQHDGGIIYCNWTDGSVVSHEFGSWNVYEIPFKFTAKKAGTSTYTFTNSINDESFSVLVIVVDD